MRVRNFKNFLNESVSRQEAEKHYLNHGRQKENICQIDGRKVQEVPAGTYTFMETDYGGMRDSAVLTIEVSSPMNPFELAVQIGLKTGYLSPWCDMSLYTPEFRRSLELPKIIYKFPMEFDEVDDNVIAYSDEIESKVRDLVQDMATKYHTTTDAIRLKIDEILNKENFRL